MDKSIMNEYFLKKNSRFLALDTAGIGVNYIEALEAVKVKLIDAEKIIIDKFINLIKQRSEIKPFFIETYKNNPTRNDDYYYFKKVQWENDQQGKNINNSYIFVYPSGFKIEKTMLNKPVKDLHQSLLLYLELHQLNKAVLKIIENYLKDKEKTELDKAKARVMELNNLILEECKKINDNPNFNEASMLRGWGVKENDKIKLWRAEKNKLMDYPYIVTKQDYLSNFKIFFHNIKLKELLELKNIDNWQVTLKDDLTVLCNSRAYMVCQKLGDGSIRYLDRKGFFSAVLAGAMTFETEKQAKKFLSYRRIKKYTIVEAKTEIKRIILESENSLPELQSYIDQSTLDKMFKEHSIEQIKNKLKEYEEKNADKQITDLSPLQPLQNKKNKI